MRKRICRVVPALLGWLAAAGLAFAGPRLFFTDLESGPNTGGERDGGAFVTLYGKGFGSSQGASFVTVNGRRVGAYPHWSDEKIAVQLGPRAQSGPIQVSTVEGASNTLPFTVRPGRIFFVSTRGSDRGSGGFADPFASIPACKKAMRPGDICYAMDGVKQTTVEAYNAMISMSQGGDEGRPMALVAYPNARVRVGEIDSGTARVGIRIPNTRVTANYWVIAGLEIVARAEAVLLGGVSGSVGWRLVGNRMSCPYGDGPTACVETSRASQLAFLGNEVFEAGCAPSHPCASGRSMPSKLYHTVYFSTDTNHVEAAWNYLHDNRSCRGMQFHSSPVGPALPPPAAPAVETVAANASLPERRYAVRVTYTVRVDSVTPLGYRETTASAETSLSVPAGRLLKVRSPQRAHPAATGYSVYVAPDAASAPERQNQPAAPVPIGTDWVEPASGAVRNGPPPDRNYAYVAGFNQFGLDVHDNIIRDQVCDGLNFATVDPSKTKVRAYNNVISHVGVGPDPPPDSSNYSCIYVAGLTNNGAHGKGAVEIFNNTLYDCGRRGGGAAGALARGNGSPELTVSFWNNAVFLLSGEQYLSTGLPQSISGSHNLWYGAGSLPRAANGLNDNIYADPRFVAADKGNFRPTTGSPLTAKGRGPGPSVDAHGRSRPKDRPAIGAFEPEN